MGAAAAAMALSGTWEELKVMGAKPVARSAHAMAANGEALFLFGGMSTDAEGEPVPLNDVYTLTLDGKPQWKVVKSSGDVPIKREGISFNI